MNKNKLSVFITMFSELTTSIILVSSVYVAVFKGFHSEVDLDFIWGVLAIAFISSLCYLPLLNDMSRKKYLFWWIFYLLVINVVVFVTGLFLNWVSFDVPASVIGLEIVYIVVTATVCLTMWLSSRHIVQTMNEQLKKVKQS